MTEHQTREDWDTIFRIYSQERAINYSWYHYRDLLEKYEKLVKETDSEKDEEIRRLRREVERLKSDKQSLHNQLNYWRHANR